MQASRVLRKTAAPRERRGEKERVEPRVVESFAEERSGRDEYSALVRRHGGNVGRRGGERLRTESADEFKHVFRAAPAQFGGEYGNVRPPVGEDHGRPTVRDARHGVIRDPCKERKRQERPVFSARFQAARRIPWAG